MAGHISWEAIAWSFVIDWICHGCVLRVVPIPIIHNTLCELACASLQVRRRKPRMQQHCGPALTTGQVWYFVYCERELTVMPHAMQRMRKARWMQTISHLVPPYACLRMLACWIFKASGDLDGNISSIKVWESISTQPSLNGYAALHHCLHMLCCREHRTP